MREANLIKNTPQSFQVEDQPGRPHFTKMSSPCQWNESSLGPQYVANPPSQIHTLAVLVCVMCSAQCKLCPNTQTPWLLSKHSAPLFSLLCLLAVCAGPETEQMTYSQRRASLTASWSTLRTSISEYKPKLVECTMLTSCYFSGFRQKEMLF